MRKANAHEIELKVDQLQTAPWLDASRRWWPKYLFHFTDIQNAAEILNSGKLKSRKEIQRVNGLKLDCASADVLANTKDEYKAYARLYMKPRSPMQFNTEGFRPLPNIGSLGAHCPVPVVFLFDSKSILTEATTKFSTGNLGADNPSVGDSATFYKSLPFEDIYHDQSLHHVDQARKREIILRRHAEVIVPKELDLSNLRLVWCRSEAEKETLLNLLNFSTRRAWRDKTGVGAKNHVFYNDWNFVDSTDLSAHKIRLRFHQHISVHGPFHAKLEITLASSGLRLVWEDLEYTLGKSQSYTLTTGNPDSESYKVKFFLDGKIAYYGSYVHIVEDLPW